MTNEIRSLYRDCRGNMALIYGLAFVPLVLLAGGAIDYSRATEKKSDLQQALDAGVLAAARNGQASASYLKNLLDANLKSRGASVSNAALAKETAPNGRVVYKGDANFAVTTNFLKIIGVNSINVSAHSEVTPPGAGASATEIALVVDVSSSMMEEARFAPMQAAVENFVDVVSNTTTGLKNWKLSLVPFSSRINLGMDQPSMRMAWNGNPATPTRWSDPTSVYNSSFRKVAWVDGVNFAMYNGRNIYWMGCVEPRLDFAVRTGGSTTNAMTDASPSAAPFVPQDDNPKSGKSFCPPPVTPLTSDARDLRARVEALTAQGSTRLDAGMLGGWYALSPNWASAWPSQSSPAAYSAARKYVVFMTDGRMNTKDDPSEKEYDWVCEASGDCDTYVNKQLASTCDAIKAAGITIFTIAYDKSADKKYIKACATSADHFFVASSTETGDAAIKAVYANIASSIVGATGVLRVSK